QIAQKARVNGKVLYETKNKAVDSPIISFGQGATLMTGYNDALETHPAQFQYTASGDYTLTSQTLVDVTWGLFQNQTGAPTISPKGTKSDIGLGSFPMLFPDAASVDPRFNAYSRLVADNPPWVVKNGSTLLVPLQPTSNFLTSGFVYNNDDFYVQDNWRVTDRLTMDYGIRFVHQQPGHDDYGLASNFVQSAWNPAQAPLLYVPACAPGVATLPCTGS